MTNPRTLDRLEERVGDLLERHGEPDDLPDLSQYADDPVGFIRDVLGDHPWRKQVEIAEAVRDSSMVAVRSCNGSGKDWIAARLALWWAYCREGLVVLTGPTQDQVQEILMRKELRQAFVNKLPGDLGVRALRPHGEGRAGVLAKTASQVSALTGLHDARVLFCISEAQHEGLGLAFDAAFANAVGAEDRIFVYGNPMNPVGPFYEAHRPGSGWRSIRIAASDVPNVREGEPVIPGLMTREGVDRIRKRDGEDSGFYKARVLGEFPEEQEHGLVRRDWLDDASDRHEEGSMHYAVADNREQRILAVDVAGAGSDKTVVAVRRGPVLEEFKVWGNPDTEEVAERVHDLAADMGQASPYTDRPMVKTIWIDAVGIGKGVFDKLKKQDTPWAVKGYKGSRSARQDSHYRNLRSEAYWKIRDRLEEGEIALPPDEELFRELLALRYRADGQGRIVLEAKADLKDRLGRSPDRADALAMAFHRDGSGGLSSVQMVTKW